MNIERFTKFKEEIIKNVSKVIIGKDKEIELIIVAFLSGGHVLLEDIPGTGKTMMVKAFSKTLNLPFKRIQFTPDLLPRILPELTFIIRKLEIFSLERDLYFQILY